MSPLLKRICPIEFEIVRVLLRSIKACQLYRLIGDKARLTHLLNSYSVKRDISCAKIVLPCNLLKFKLLNTIGDFFSGH